MPKIILKPRLARLEAAENRRSRTPAVPTPPPPREQDNDDDNDDVEDEDVHAKREESEGILDDEEPDVDEGEGEGEVDEGEGVGEEMGEEGVESQSFSRSRGRPRGRARGAVPAGTPRARGRGRGKPRARARGKGPGARPSQDVDGEVQGEEGGNEDGRPWRRVGDRVYYIERDEFVTEPDEKGDQKIDIDGILQGGELDVPFCQSGNLIVTIIGRRFKCSTFVLPTRHPTRHYMLAIDAARSSGFRDSLYYFRKNALALKLSASQPEKELLIQAGKLGAHLKTRSVTLVTARSAYKLHGAKMIIGKCSFHFICICITIFCTDGCWVTDDYYEDRALQDITAKGIIPGSPVGELPDPTATASSNLPANALPAQASSGVSHGVYRAGGPTTLFGGAGLGPFSDGPHSAVRKSMLSRDGLSSQNWMAEAARRVSEMNGNFAKMRREAMVPCGGILDDGAKAKLKEQSANMAGDSDGSTKKKRKAEHSQFPLGVYEPHTGMVCCKYFEDYLRTCSEILGCLDRSDTQPTRCRWEQVVARRVLGGTKVGNGAWALAWVDTCLDLPGPKDLDPGADERAALMTSVI